MSLLSEKAFNCPYCGSRNEMSLDRGQGKQYEMVTDCEVCCRPIIVHVKTMGNDCALEVYAENG